jgi:hypothetical protein
VTLVDRMLESSVKPTTLAKYSCLWDKWIAFAAFHDVKMMPPQMGGLEIFIVDLAELSGSSGVANSTAAAVAHFCELEGFPSPFVTPRFSKLLRRIRLTYGKAARPKRPFTREHIVGFLKAARTGSLLDWRAALPLAMCYQQQLRGAECFNLNGSNVVRQPTFFLVDVKSAKNNPDGFDFKIQIDPMRATCVGQFLADYIVKMAIVLRDKESYFECKVVSTKGVLAAVPSVKVGTSTMRSLCKRLIEAVGLDSTISSPYPFEKIAY